MLKDKIRAMSLEDQIEEIRRQSMGTNTGGRGKDARIDAAPSALLCLSLDNPLRSVVLSIVEHVYGTQTRSRPSI